MSATLAGFGAILLWSCLALLTAMSGTVPPFELAAVSFAIGGCVGLVVTAVRHRLSAFRQPWRVWALGVGGLFGYHALYFAALRQAPPAQAGLIAYLWPLLIVLMSSALPGERLSRRHLCGAALGLAGVSALILGNTSEVARFDPRHAAGYLLALTCAFVWSSYSVMSRRFENVPTEAVAGFCLVTSALAAIAHGLFESTVWPSTMGQQLAIIGLGLGPVGAAFFLWDVGVKKGDIRALGVLSYAAPILSTIVLVLSGHAQATSALGLACLLIVAGAAVAALGSKREVRSLTPGDTGESVGRAGSPS